MIWNATIKRHDGVSEILKWVQAMLPALGVTRIADVTGLDRIGFPVVAVCRPLSKSLSVSQGKGSDLDTAKVSGIMESIEGYHAENISRPLRLATWRELARSERVVDPHTLPRVSVSDYHEDLKLLWIEATDVVTETSRWVPFELVHLDFTLPLPSGSGAFVLSSNGLAAGATIEDAIVHGMCEVIERDAVSVFNVVHGRRRQHLRIDPRSVHDPGCVRLMEILDRAAIDVVVWNATSDIGVPCFVVEVVDRAENPIAPSPAATGKGCHPNPAKALFGALAEAIQVRLTIISGAREDAIDRVYEGREAAQFLRKIVKDPAITQFSEIVSVATGDAAGDITRVAELLGRAGLGEVLIVDLSKEEFGVPVVRVVVPKCEGPNEAPGYVPGPRARRAIRSAAT